MSDLIKWGTLLALAVACAGHGNAPTVPPGLSGLVMQNCMVSQTTAAQLFLDSADSGVVGLPPAQQQGAVTVCSDSRVYRITNGTHHTVVQGSGSCSGPITALDQQRPFRGETTYVGLDKAGC